MTKRVVLIGHPVAHSLSGAMQQAAFDYLGIDATYETWDRAPIELADWSSLPPEELEDKETWDVLSEAVEQLPEDLRIVFLRRDWLEESNAEVAEGLGLTVAAVKSRLHRARIQLRDRLSRHFAGKTARRSKREEDETE